MGIKLREHINYNVESWITKEEAEKLFIASGYQEAKAPDSKQKLKSEGNNQFNEVKR